MKQKKKSMPSELKKIEKAIAKTSVQTNKTGNMWTLKDFWSFWLVGGVILLLGYFLFQSLYIIYLLCAGFILSMSLENVIAWMEQWMRRGMAIFVAYILLTSFVLSGIVIVIPFVVQQIADIINIVLIKISALQTLLQNQGLEYFIINSNIIPLQRKEFLLSSLGDGSLVGVIQEALIVNMSQIIQTGSGYIKNAGDLVVSLLGGFFSGLTQIVIVLVTAIFFSIEKNNVIAFFAYISGRKQYTTLKLLKLYKQLGYRLKGQLLLCFLIGCMTWFGLEILGWIGIDLSSKFTLALIAGLTEFIPYVGPLIGMLPALLIGGLSFGRTGIIAVGIMYLIIQQSEGAVLVPVVMHQQLGVSPLLIFLSMLLGGSLFGVLGVVLAVPCAVIIKILFENNGDNIDNIGTEKS